MLRRLPTPVLVIVTLAAVGLDLAISSPLAFGEDVRVETAEPAEIPGDAFMTGPVVDEAEIAGLSAALESRDGGLALALANVGEEAVPLNVDVRLMETRGSSFGRMMPMPVEISRRDLVEVVEPGERITVPLDWDQPEGPLEPGGFHTVEVALVAGDEHVGSLRHTRDPDLPEG